MMSSEEQVMGWTPNRVTVELHYEDCVLREEEPGYFLGWFEFLGTNFHVEAMRVVENEDGQHEAWHPECGAGDPDNMNDERLGKLWCFSEDDFSTVNLPGVKGDFVLVITPYCR